MPSRESRTAFFLPLVGMKKLTVDRHIHLSPPTADDIPYWVDYLTDPTVHRTTLRVPYPYTAKDGRAFLKMYAKRRRESGKQLFFVIRNSAGEAIGGIGFHGKYGKDSHADEIGYVLSRKYRRKGIMTRVIRRMCRYGFEELKLVRIEATVFPFNIASMNLVKKCGFRFEGQLRKCYRKNGRYIDGLLFAKTK